MVNAEESPEGYLLEHYFMTEKIGNVGKSKERPTT
jgi:hypothetical protein